MKEINKINVTSVGAPFVGIPVRHDTTVPEKRTKTNITPVGACIARPLNATHGITIISLVITIIIMLILAGVVLNLTIGERGIFNTAKSTKDIQRIAEYKDDVEISRVGVAVENLGQVTIDNLIEEIYGDKIVSRGSIEKLDETRGKMTTKEGYVFIITADGIEYIGKEDEIPTPPELQEGDLVINAPTWNASTHKADVTITKGTNVENGLNIQYQVNSTTGIWTTGTSVTNLSLNDTVYARLWNGINGGKYTSLKITDKVNPTSIIQVGNVNNKTVEITINGQDNETGIKEYKLYMDEELVKTIATEKNEIKVTLETTFGEKQCYAIATDNAGNDTKSKEETIEDYTIKTAEEMIAFRDSVNKDGKRYKEKTVELVANIDLKGSQTNQWIPISTFNGTFNGNYYSLSNIYVNSTRQVIGLFGMVDTLGTVENLYINNINLSNNDNEKEYDHIYSGGIAGINLGTIKNCGIKNGTISSSRKSTNNGEEWKYVRVGGIAGDSHGIIQNCYNAASISGTNSRCNVFYSICRRNFGWTG